MSTVGHVRFHGRGGEGVKLASRIVSRALFQGGFSVQDSPLYGAERRGAPVVAFVRFGDGPIHERGYITAPDVTVVLDESLLQAPEAAVLDGVAEGSLLLLNSSRPAAAWAAELPVPVRVLAQDVSSIALAVLGRHLLSAPMAGFALKVLGRVDAATAASALRRELEDEGLAAAEIERNLVAAREAFERAPAPGPWPVRASAAVAAVGSFVVPRLPARLAAPTVEAAANSALRHTDGWRVHRPLIDLARCTRCFLCFALCPEGAIHLDATHAPVVDYDHCKGCLLCATECPPGAIATVREVHP